MRDDEMSLRDVKVGDEIIVINNSHRDRDRQERRHKVVRVGRLNVAIEQYGREVAFAIADGLEKRRSDAPGQPGRAYTEAGLALSDRRDAAIDRLNAIVKRWSWTDRYSTGDLEALTEWLEAHATNLE